MKIIHGHTRGHRFTGTYYSWMAMRNRCLYPRDPSFPNYGGRGIRVCDRWLTFANFLDDMGERPGGTSIDRIDSDGDYRPGNCRWATREEQRRNQRPPTRKRGRNGLPRGVWPLGRKYRALIGANYKDVHLGIFDSIDHAAHAYNKAAIEMHGDRAILNPVGTDPRESQQEAKAA